MAPSLSWLWLTLTSGRSSGAKAQRYVSQTFADGGGFRFAQLVGWVEPSRLGKNSWRISRLSVGFVYDESHAFQIRSQPPSALPSCAKHRGLCRAQQSGAGD